MNRKEYNKIIKELSRHRRGVADEKREDYTRSSKDVLANFKNVAESTGVSPLQVWLVYTQKHFDAIANYVKSDGQSESEPIRERFADALNYLELGYGLVKEKESREELEDAYENVKPKLKGIDSAYDVDEGFEEFELDIVQVDQITEEPPYFVVYSKGDLCKFLGDDEVKDVKTDDELTITRLETTDGTIYRV